MSSVRLLTVFCSVLWTSRPSSMAHTTSLQDSPIPLIDLSAWTTSPDSSTTDRRDIVVDQVRSACQETGFFAIVNHGVNPQILEHAWNVSSEFFSLPLEQKLLAATPNAAEYPYGYECSETLALGKARDVDEDDSSHKVQALPDLKETFALGPKQPASGMPPRRIPRHPQDMESALDDYYVAMEQLATLLLDVMAVALDLPQNWFHDKFDRHQCALRLLNYPNLGNITPPPGQMRAGAHTDYGAITILKSGGPGLQLKLEDGWMDIPHLDNAFIINLGDLMQRWTNDKWISTLHRVVVPPPDGNDHRRQSIAFFVNMNGDAEVVPFDTCVDDNHPAKYKAITAGEHLMAKHLASMGVLRRDEL